MLTINVLPEQEKAAIRLEKWRRIAIFLSGILGMALIFGLTLLTPSYLPLSFQRQELQRALHVEQEAATAKNTDQIRTEVGMVRNTIAAINQAINAPARASEIIEVAFQPVQHITVVSIATEKSGTIAITGIAKTRNDLLDYEQHLRESGKFQEITAPLSDIVQETNINFTFQGTLKPQYSL